MQNQPTQLTPEQVNYAESAQWRQIIQQELDELRCASPAYLVEDIDPTTQTCTVQIAIQERTRTLLGPKWVSIVPIIKVPVVMPRGGGYAVTLPLKKGDEGLLVFCDTCFDLWWARGASAGPQQQLEVHRHDVHDCGFQPGMWSQPNVLSKYSTSSIQVRTEAGDTVIDLTTGAVRVYGSSDPTKAQKLVTNDFYTWYTTNLLPFLQSKGYAGPDPPITSVTSVLEGE